MYNVYSIFFIDGLHDWLIQYGAATIILSGLSINILWTIPLSKNGCHSTMKKPTSVIVELVSTITREHIRVLVESAPHMLTMKEITTWKHSMSRITWCMSDRQSILRCDINRNMKYFLSYFSLSFLHKYYVDSSVAIFMIFRVSFFITLLYNV